MSNTIRIGAFGEQTRALIQGVYGVTTVLTGNQVLIDQNGQLGTISSSRRVKDDIEDMGDASSLLMKLRPVTFHYKAHANNASRTLQYGLIAEEVEDVAPGLVAHSTGGEADTVFYQFLPPMLLNEYQRQQRTIEAQASELSKHEARIAAQARRVADMELDRKTQLARIDALERQAAEFVALKGQVAEIAALKQQVAQLVRLQGDAALVAALDADPGAK